MRQCAAEKQGGLGACDLHRVEDLAVQEEGFPHVVQQHEENDQPAQSIDRAQP
ncbi:hypothetical protein ALO43_200122 [Pseudomonas tremae]|uniref:Uncharacterized protein n=1 Tax=Pseudomonas tremae TaxID=200454 RepID=A0AA40P0Q7_9PSED|nr:hypothetical protein ALO43_200122 [Pseudomonas tremae]